MHNSTTGSMVLAIKAELQNAQHDSSTYVRDAFEPSDLVLLRLLGKGGFGRVYEGLWRGCRAAVKVSREGCGQL
jgi:predicted Ser/Thr protein kinase